MATEYLFISSVFYPLNPNIKMHILLTVLHISLGTSKENLFKYQDILSLVITFFILIAWMFEQVVVM